MKSIGELLLFHCVGLYGQWLGYCKGWPFLITFWLFVTALIWLRESPAMVAVVANQCSRLMAPCSSPLYPEFPELGVIKPVDWTPEPDEWDNSGRGKLQRIKEWCNSSEDLKLLL